MFRSGSALAAFSKSKSLERIAPSGVCVRAPVKCSLCSRSDSFRKLTQTKSSECHGGKRYWRSRTEELEKRRTGPETTADVSERIESKLGEQNGELFIRMIEKVPESHNIFCTRSTSERISGVDLANAKSKIQKLHHKASRDMITQVVRWNTCAVLRFCRLLETKVVRRSPSS
jgi:hypothetical protein